MDAGRADFFLPTSSVAEVGVAAVDENVTRLEQGSDLFDDGIRATTGLDHHDDATRALEACDKASQIMERQEGSLVPVLGHDLVGARSCAVVNGDPETLVGHVAGQVGPHHGHPDDADLGGLRRSVTHAIPPRCLASILPGISAWCRRGWVRMT